jgi:two-component system nitrogen regulation response regulator NtrX
MKPHVLLIDDDEVFSEDLAFLLSDHFKVARLSDGRQALDRIAATGPDVVLLDIELGSGIDGLDILARIRREAPEIPVIMVTRHDDSRIAGRAWRLGAADYLEKGEKIEFLSSRIEKAVTDACRRLEHQVLCEERDLRAGRLVGSSPTMRELVAKIDQLAGVPSTVLITGETGTGKELVAREIHARSPRARRLFVPVCCPAIPESLVESELFGHEKGAFTGATAQKKGRFEQAHRGTLFLDEISELNISAQAKLLRVLQDHRVCRVGGSREMHVDVRILAATNRDLERMVEEGLFKRDLFFRLNVIPLQIPPLRDRLEDIPLLVEALVTRKARELGRRPCRFTPAAMDRLLSWSWPGNVRELENTIERAMVHFRGEIIDEDLISGTMDVDLTSLTYAQAKKRAEMQFEHPYVLLMLRRYDWNVSEVARRMEITRQGLQGIMQRLGVTRPA